MSLVAKVLLVIALLVVAFLAMLGFWTVVLFSCEVKAYVRRELRDKHSGKVAHEDVR